MAQRSDRKKADLFELPEGSTVIFTTRSGSQYKVTKNRGARKVGMGVQAGLTISSNSPEFKLNSAVQNNYQGFRNIEIGSYWFYDDGFEPKKAGETKEPIRTSTVTAIIIVTP